MDEEKDEDASKIENSHAVADIALKAQLVWVDDENEENG